jgi:hypothetical protein
MGEIISQDVSNRLKRSLGHYTDLTSITLQLEQKANKTEISSLTSGKADITYVDTKVGAVASGSPKGVYTTLSALQTAFPTGNSNVYIVSADGKWYYWSGSTWTAGGTYLSQVNVATNFELHKQTDGWLNVNRGTDFVFTEGQALLSTDGTTSTSGAYNSSLYGVSAFIDVTGYSHVNALIQKNDGLSVAAIAFYDVSNVFISSFTDNVEASAFRLISIPSNAVKIKYCYYTDARADAKAVPRLSYIQFYNQNSLTEKNNALQTDVTKLKNRYVQSDNLFNKNAVTLGKEIQSLSGIGNNANMSYTELIPVVTGESLYAVATTSAVVAGYTFDSNKVKLNLKTFNFADNNKNDITDTNVAYVQFNVPINSLDTFMLRKKPIVRYEDYEQLSFNKVKNFNNTALNWWQDKNGDSLGDSLTGSGYFQKYVRQYFNLSKFTNHGIGGTKLSGSGNGYGASMWEDARINTLDADADFITVMGGANDNPVTIGDLTLENIDTNTYAGALNVLISKIYYKYQKLSAGYYAGITYTGVTQIPTAKNILIFLCTPFYMPNETDPYRTKNLANAVREIAKLWGIPVMDLASKSGLNSGVKDVYWASNDRVHPIEIGQRDRIVPVMIGEMENFKPVDFTKAYYV